MVDKAAFLVGLLLLPVIVGLAMIWRGLWPKRRGETPHCPQCDYNLTALTADRCPECGTTVMLARIVYGERHRRPVLAAVGLLFVLLPAGLFVAALAEANWYRWTPTFWLVRQAASQDAATARRAWTELDGRIRADKLSASDHARLVEVGLAEQGAATAGPIRDELLNYVGDRLLKGGLSKAQEDRFFAQLFVLDLKVRPKVVRGEDVPYSVSYRGRGPSSGAGLRYEVRVGEDIAIDGKALPKRGRSSGSGSGSSGGAMTLSVPCKEVGTHTLIVTPEVVVFTGTGWDATPENTINTRKVPLEAWFEVLAAEPPDYIRLVKDPVLIPRLHAAIKPNRFEWRPGSSERDAGRYRLDGTIEFGVMPTNVAFDVIARFDGRELRVGGVHVRRGGGTHWGIGSDYRALEKLPPKVDIVLRSSEKVARGTVDLFEIWDGELVYEDVPVAGATTATAPATASAPAPTRP